MKTVFISRGFGPTRNDRMNGVVGRWQSVMGCTQCRMIATEYRANPVHPCPLCGGQVVEEIVAKWIEQTRRFWFFGKVTQKAGWLVLTGDNYKSVRRSVPGKQIDFSPVYDNLKGEYHG